MVSLKPSQRVAAGIIGVVSAFALLVVPFSALSSAETDIKSRIAAQLGSEHPFEELSSAAPAISKPKWYTNVTFTYSVSKNGATSGDLAEFSRLANETLNDTRGWTRLGVQFKEVTSGGNFRLILAQASLMSSYSSGCTADWSCNVGNSVIINDDRWMNASPSWNNAGGTLRDYRNMVVNHETGHWLGHGHTFCNGGGKATVMQQQSIDLQGCTFNPWPLESELWSTRL